MANPVVRTTLRDEAVQAGDFRRSATLNPD